MLIIGITGTLGSGKGMVVDYLVNEKGFLHFSARKFLIQKMKQKDMEINLTNMTLLGNELRVLHSPSYIADSLFKEAIKTGKDCVIESLRTPGEIESLRIRGKFILIAVDAPAKLRYKRIVERGGEGDIESIKNLMKIEKQQMHSTDPNKHNLQKCMDMADYKFVNDGTIEDLHRNVERVLGLINLLPTSTNPK